MAFAPVARLLLAVAALLFAPYTAAQDSQYETVLRFECKMQLQYAPSVNRFLFFDNDKRFFTECTFEDLMWHHAMVSIDENGKGYIAVDGEVQVLQEAVDMNDLGQGFNEPFGKEFTTTMFANKCMPKTFIPPTLLNRRLNQMDDLPEDVYEDQSAANILPYGTGFPELDSDLVEDIENECCSFKMGRRCTEDMGWGSEVVSRGFAGFIDEVVVYNKQLDPALLPVLLFKMPGYLPDRDLEAPRGVQTDYTIGRVLYVRFNNPCLEAPVQAPPSPPPPSPECDNEGCYQRKLLQMSGTDGVRVEFITDKAGYTGGTSINNSYVEMDLDNDFVTFSDFPYNSKYVYTGVPWTDPGIGEIHFEHPAMDGGKNSLPMDGGVTVTVSGVGFARSPWIKCGLVQPDPNNLYVTEHEGPRSGYKAYDGNATYSSYWEGLPSQVSMQIHAPHDYHYSSQVLFTPAAPVFEEWTDSPKIYKTFSQSWNPLVLDTRVGRMNPFTENLKDPYYRDFIFGYWETLTCNAPSGAFPSNEYSFGVTNNGGISISPPFQTTMEDYAAEFSHIDGGVVTLPDSMVQAMGNTFSVGLWLFPETIDTTELQTVFQLTHTDLSALFTGVFINATTSTISVFSNGKEEEESRTVIAMEEWHYVVLVCTVTQEGGRLKFFVDGEVALDENGIGVDFIQFDPYPRDFTVGEKFEGKVDELKVWPFAMTNEQAVDPVYMRRENPEDPTGLTAYYRFNFDFKDEVEEFAPLVEGEVGLVPMPSPWEPAIIYSINGHEFDPETRFLDMIKSTIAGGEEVSVTGFNFAPSPWRKCVWGKEPETIQGLKFYPQPLPNYTCPVGLSSLGRIDGQVTAQEKYHSMFPVPLFSTTPFEATTTTMKCLTPEASTPQFTYFTASLGPVMNSQPFELTDRSLYCDGMSAYVSADSTVDALDSWEEYSFSFWTFPTAPDAPEDAAARRRHLSSIGHDKKFRSRALQQTDEDDVPLTPLSTVLAFEGPLGENKALLTYDGSLFRYFDDNILDAHTVSGNLAPPGEWHIVTVTVTSDGEGFLYVDNEARERFTTRSRPVNGGKFSVCQDWHYNTPSSFYMGFVDDIKIFNTVLTVDVPTHHLQAMPSFGTGLSVLFDFKKGVEPITAEGVLTGEMGGSAALVETQNPRMPPTVVAMDPPGSEASAGTPVKVYGTNFAISKWLLVNFDGGRANSDSEVRLESEITGTVAGTTVGLNVITPSVDVCSTVDVTASNDNGATDGVGVKYEYHTTESDLSKGLLMYYNMDLQGDLDADTVMYKDLVGGNDFEYYKEFATADRDGYEASAITFGTGLGEEGVITLPVTPRSLDADGGLTACMWLLMDTEYLEMLWSYYYATGDPENVFAALSETFSSNTGGWKQYCWVKADDDADSKIFINYVEFIAPTPESKEVFDTMFRSLVYEGTLTCGYVANLTCMLDSVWIYDRPMKPCEIASRYFTQEYSIDFSAPGSHLSLDLPVTEFPAKITMEAWVFPFNAEGRQTIVEMEGIASLGMHGESVSFGIFKGCSCAPCNMYWEVHSWRAHVRSGTWSHIAVEFDGYKLALFIDGILKDVVVVDYSEVPYDVLGNIPWAEYISQFVAGASGPAAGEQLSLEGSKLTAGANFQGMVYEARVTPYIIPRQQLYAYTVCPRKERMDGSMMFRMNEGYGDKVYLEDDTVIAWSGASTLWTNSSYDDYTDVTMTEIAGAARFGAEAGHPGKFTITSRTRCGKKRVIGGDNWSVSMLLGNDLLFPQKRASGDGTYDFYYWAGAKKMSMDLATELGEGFPCGNYTTSVKLDDVEVMSFMTSIAPSWTNRTNTYIVGGTPTQGPFGVMNTFTIQTMDSHGCDMWGSPDTDRFSVTCTGPYDFAATVAGVGAGQYVVSFVPEVPGPYHCKVLMDGEPIQEGIFCYEATYGTSGTFSGSNVVVVEEDNPDVSDIDMSFDGVTFETWLQVASKSDSYVFFKGKVDEVEEYYKGYEMSIIGDVLQFSVYAGDGRIRSTALDLAGKYELNEWYHLAAVYDGESFTMYFNGNKVTFVPFEDKRPVKVNMYDHPLTIGYNFIGVIDELTFWKVPLSQEELKGFMWCPPMTPSVLENVAAYFNFNEGKGGVTIGHGYACAPLDTTCLVGTGVTFPDGSKTAMVNPFEGVAAADPDLSAHLKPQETILAGQLDAPYSIHAVDKCGYKYVEGTLGTFTTAATRFALAYLNEAGPGVEYPNTLTTQKLTGLDVKPTGGICPGMGDGDGETVGDVYHADMSSVTQVGYYYLTIATNGVAMHGDPYLMVVVPNVPASFALIEGMTQAQFATGLVAGLPKQGFVHMLDAHGNVCTLNYRLQMSVTAAITGKSFEMAYTVDPDDIDYEDIKFVYSFFFTVGMAGSYDITLAGPDSVTPLVVKMEAAGMAWQMVDTNEAVPDDIIRYEHSAVVYDDNLWIFGGASKEKKYLSDMWVLNDIPGDDLMYVKSIAVTAEGEFTGTLEVLVNTKELIAAGHMNDHCSDLVFSAPTSPVSPQPFYWAIDPEPQFACDSTTTKYYVKVEGGITDTLLMYYGSPQAHLEINEYESPEEVFAFYEGFEDFFSYHTDNDSGGSMGKFQPVTPCGGGAKNWFPNVLDNFPYKGKRSLYQAWNKTQVLEAMLNSTIEGNFRLSAMFWDSGAVHASHFISPNFGDCTVDDHGKHRLPTGYGPLEATSTAVGVFTMSHKTKYCVASPWQKTSADRTGLWHRFEVISTLDGNMEVRVDGEVVKSEAGSISMDRVSITQGYGVDFKLHDGLAESHAFWDEIAVLELIPVTAVAAPMADDQPVSIKLGLDDTRVWSKVEYSTESEPPPRYSHSALVYQDTMVLFGGERSAHSFGDVWIFDFAEHAWSFVTPKGLEQEFPTPGNREVVVPKTPAPRFDHSAIIAGDNMIIYGGRSGKTMLGDMWSFSMVTHTWTLLAETTPFGLRFGHSAAVSGNDMYLFGGYTELGFSNSLYKCDVTTGECFNAFSGACAGGSVPSELTSRYAHTSYSDGHFLYIYGGSNLLNTDGFSTVFMMALDTCEWSEMEIDGTPLGRYEHTMAVDGERLYVHGGHYEGVPTGSTYWMSLGH